MALLRVSTEAQRLGEQPATTPDEPPPKPKIYLAGRRDILDALDKKNTTENWRRVTGWNEAYDGPIIVKGGGSQPRVEKTKLIEWYNHLEIVWEGEANQQAGRKADAANQHAYGRSGTAVPDIGGQVKKKRQSQVTKPNKT